MKCTKCEYYSFPLKRCKFGQINPPTLKGGAEAMLLMGVSCICGIDKTNVVRKHKMMAILDGLYHQATEQTSNTVFRR